MRLDLLQRGRPGWRAARGGGDVMWRERSKVADDMGLPDSTLRGWQWRHLTRGHHYQVIGRSTLWHVERVNEWISYREAAQQKPQASVSGSGAEGSTTQRRFTATHDLRLSDAVRDLDMQR